MGLDGTGNIRARQSVFLDDIPTQDLATLGVMVEVMGQAFFSMTKRLLSPEFQSNENLFPESSESSYFHSPTAVPYNESMNENWIRECMCVFEDCKYSRVDCPRSCGTFENQEYIAILTRDFVVVQRHG